MKIIKIIHSIKIEKEGVNLNMPEYYNFERKYYLGKHIESNKTRRYTSGELKYLFAETNNQCGKCNKPLKWFDENNIKSFENQIAHIYGKKLFSVNKLPLNVPYHINSEAEINRYHNLLILCDCCHKAYDKIPTYEKYTSMLETKARIAHRASDKTHIYFAIEEILNLIEGGAFDSLSPNHNQISDYSKTKLRDKLSYNNVNRIMSNRIEDDISKYFKSISEILSEANDIEKLLSSYNSVYNNLKNRKIDKNIILKRINNALIITEFGLFDEVVPIITSYMIMICEVLDNVPK